MSYDLPSGFSRAEASWLEPPEYRPTPDDAAEDLDRLKKRFADLTEKVAEEFFGEIDDSGDIPRTIERLKVLISQLETLQEEMEEAEHMLRYAPDPDYEWDNRPAEEAWV